MASKKPWYYDIQLTLAEAWEHVRKATAGFKKNSEPQSPAAPEPPSLVKNNVYWTIIWLNYGLLIGLGGAVGLIYHEVWFITVAIVVLQAIISYGQTGDSEIAVLTFLGIPIREVKVGSVFLHLEPYMNVRRGPSIPVQFDFPGPLKNIFYGDDKLEPPPGQVRAFRVISGQTKPDYAGVLKTEMTVTAAGFVRIQIEHLITFIRNVPGRTTEEKFAELEHEVFTVWCKSVEREYSQRTPGEIRDKNATEISDQIQQDIAEMIKNRGLRIVDSGMHPINLGHDLSGKMSDIAEAEAEAQASNKRADAAAYATVKEGEAEGAADLARKKAEAEGVAYEAEKLNMDASAIFMTRALKDIVGDKDKMFFGVDSIFSMAGAAFESLRRGANNANKQKEEETDAAA